MIGRNDPCWCGSGKKYKKCHMQSDSGKNSASKATSLNPMIKTPEEIAGMRKAGKFNGILMDYIRPFVKAEISTEKLNTIIHNYTVKQGHAPACLGYHSFPKSVCISINDVVCHGIPSKKTILKDGDIVNIDLTTIVDGFYGDSSETFMIGDVSDEARHLVKVTAHALIKGIEAVKPGNPLSAIGQAIEPFVNSYNCSVVRQYTGHGIGKKFHEFFSVYHHISNNHKNIIMQPGMTFTIEPMINLGDYKVITDNVDGWTVRTMDGSLSAQFEHTLIVTQSGADILTRTPSQIKSGILINLPE
jgi:methionyl aminopeptidase